MNYSFKEVKDKKIWNEFLEKVSINSTSTPPVTFVQSFEWLEFQQSLQNEILALGIFENDVLVGIVAGVIINAKRGKYLYVRNGPVFNWENKELVNNIIKYLKNWAKLKKLWFIRISPLLEKNSISEKNLKSFKFPKCVMHDVEALDTWIMKINEDEDTVFNSIKKKVRYEIRSAQKLGAQILITKDSNFIDDYYEILRDTVKRQKWNAYSKKYIKNEFETFAKEDRASLILIKYQDKFIAGGVFIHFANQTYYHYGASLTEFQNIPAMYLMIWEAIKLAKKKKHNYFNFWGISPENKSNHPWTGLSRFKMKFPGFAQRWTHSIDIPVSKKYWLTNLFERFDKYRKGY